MNPAEVARLRLTSHHLGGQKYDTVQMAATAMGALQAQDYASGLWSVGCRVSGSTLVAVEAALARAEIVRSWLMRGTLHIAPAADIRWMTQLLGPRVMAQYAARWRLLGIDDTLRRKAFTIFRKELVHGPRRRDVLMAALETAGVSTADQRGYHLLMNGVLACLLCLGPMDGKHPTYVLLDQWVPRHNELTRDEALATMADRYFTSHGPATIRDFAGWMGLSLTDARQGLAVVESKLVKTECNSTVYWHAPTSGLARIPTPHYALLPAFDEWVLGYKDRSMLATPEQLQRIVPGGNGVFRPTITKDGRVVGTWKKTVKKSAVRIVLDPFVPLSRADSQALQAPAEAYGQFLGVAGTEIVYENDRISSHFPVPVISISTSQYRARDRL